MKANLLYISPSDSHHHIQTDKQNLWEKALLFYLWKQGPGSHNGDVGWYLQDFYQAEERVRPRASKNTPLPFLKCSFSSFSVYLVAINLWLFSGVPARLVLMVFLLLVQYFIRKIGLWSYLPTLYFLMCLLCSTVFIMAVLDNCLTKFLNI